MAMALLPLAEVDVAFEKISEECTQSMEPLLKYFQNYWMQKVPVSLWNVADLDTRTNNNVEGDNTFTFFIRLSITLAVQDGTIGSTDGLTDSIPTFGYLSIVLKTKKSCLANSCSN
jgi:hypothetical protein